MGKKQKRTLRAAPKAAPVFFAPTILDVAPQLSGAMNQTLASCGASHKILLIGEGDFSYALGLALSLGGSNILATSYDSLRELNKKYADCKSILNRLKTTGAQVLHGIDGTKLPECFERLGENKTQSFDRIVFNFPHLGGSLPKDVIKNQEMLRQFIGSSRNLLTANGEIHIALRDTLFYQSWQIERLANSRGFELKR